MEMSRVDELIASMKSFGKEAYHKNELLDEMFSLQREIVALTFNDDHASTADLKIWDVERHLEQMNQDLGNVADEELERFEEGCKTLCNLIKAEISGNRGEYKAFRMLEYLKSNHIILKNVELRDGDLRTELDAVVITPEGITIVEVKNTAKDIFIDEEGNYFRTGEFLKWDCNIAQKIHLKEELLKKALTAGGIENVEIQCLVVFTDNRIEVQNKFAEIRTCFTSQLVSVIDGFKGQQNLSLEDMKTIESLISQAEHKQAYPFGFDVKQYKQDFAMVMVVLEEASAKAEEQPEIEEVVKGVSKEVGFMGVFKNMCESKYVRYAGSAVAGFVVSVIATVVVDSIRK